MAYPGHTGCLGTECDVQVMDGDLGHCVCINVLVVALVVLVAVAEVVVVVAVVVLVLEFVLFLYIKRILTEMWMSFLLMGGRVQIKARASNLGIQEVAQF